MEGRKQRTGEKEKTKEGVHRNIGSIFYEEDPGVSALHRNDGRRLGQERSSFNFSSDGVLATRESIM